MPNYNTRSELLFLYDVKDANPNGDPLDENKPRIDEASGRNFVTDVRLKRTIRDFLHDHRGFNNKQDGPGIFVWKYEKDDGSVEEGFDRAQAYQKKPEKILELCIDVRLFGGIIPLEKKGSSGGGKAKTLTGPVQFKMGRSLHPVHVRHIQGTAAFAGKETAKQKSFREEYVLPYSLIAFHGIVNQVAGVETHLTAKDVEFLLDGIWHGTGNLISRSKMGQLPRLLLKLDYKAPHLFIGDLDHLVELDSGNLKPVDVRSPEDYTVKLDKLVELVKSRYSGKIEKVQYAHDERLKLTLGGKPTTISDAFKDLKTEPLPFHQA